MRTITKLLLLLVSMLLVPRLSDAEVLRVTVESVSLRNQPATSGSVVATVTKGMLLEVVEKEGYWNRVRVPSTGAIGYIHSAFVEADATRPSERPSAVRNPSPPPSEPRRAETGYSDVGSFGLGGYLWSGIGDAALSPVVDFSERVSLLGTFETTNIVGYRTYGLTGNLLFRFPVSSGSSPVEFEPYFGGGMAYYFSSYSYAGSKGFTILGGTFLRFEALPHLKFSGGLMHIEVLGDTLSGAESLLFGGNTLMVGGHYFF